MGDRAPPIWASAWLRGQAPAGWQAGVPMSLADEGAAGEGGQGTGRVHVVEFFATWSPRCRRGLGQRPPAWLAGGPEGVTGLPARHLRLTGADGHGETRERVEAFLARHAERLHSDVLFDEGDLTRRAWLEGVGAWRVPTAMVVSADGRLAWVGDPVRESADLARAVEDLRRGRFDFDAAAARWRAGRLRAARIEAQAALLLDDLSRAMEAGDDARVASSADLLVRLDGERFGRLMVTRFTALATRRPADALSVAKEAASDRLADDPIGLAVLAAAILEAPPGAARDLDVSLRAALRAEAESGGESAAVLETLGRVRSARREWAQASEAFRRAAAAAPTQALRARLLDEAERAERRRAE